MLTITSSLTPDAITRVLERAGFRAVDVEPDGDEFVLRGMNPRRKDEFGGDAIIDEDDRDLVETALAEGKTQQTKVGRAHELRNKPTLTQPELAEAVQLLLAIVLEE